MCDGGGGGGEAEITTDFQVNSRVRAYTCISSSIYIKPYKLQGGYHIFLPTVGSILLLNSITGR